MNVLRILFVAACIVMPWLILAILAIGRAKQSQTRRAATEKLGQRWDDVSSHPANPVHPVKL